MMHPLPRNRGAPWEGAEGIIGLYGEIRIGAPSPYFVLGLPIFHCADGGYLYIILSDLWTYHDFRNA